MRRFLTVFEFELKNYIKNKSFMTATILIALILFALMFLPNFIDMSNTDPTSIITAEDDSVFGIVDDNKVIEDDLILQTAFPNGKFNWYDSENELRDAVENEEVDAGFLVENDTSYTYYVYNKDMYSSNSAVFEQVLSLIHKQNYCIENNLDYEEVMAGLEASINCTEQILGKDVGDNYWYSYVLVMVIFMAIIFYGVMIATSVTNEKSNRAIEVLVTSIDSTYLLFGKVCAGAIAAFIQIMVIMGALLGGYAINKDLWGGRLDGILNIPSEVLISFALFGIGGFIFYAFLYGAFGALVSKTEDINKTVGSIQLVIMIIYFAVMAQLANPDGPIIRVLSYLPISSYSAMFIRVAMGSVTVVEMIISLIILIVSIVAVGFIGSKIYRMGTLRYGNPIKITKALKDIRHSEE